MSAFEIIMASVIFAIVSVAMFTGISVNNRNLGLVNERDKIIEYYDEFSEEIISYIASKNLTGTIDMAALNTELETQRLAYVNAAYVNSVEIFLDDAITKESYFLKFVMVSPKEGLTYNFVKTVPGGGVINE